MTAASRTLPRRDRWVVALVAAALAALILGFAASAPAFEAPGNNIVSMDDTATIAPLAAPALEVNLLDASGGGELADDKEGVR